MNVLLVWVIEQNRWQGTMAEEAKTVAFMEQKKNVWIEEKNKKWFIL